MQFLHSVFWQNKTASLSYFSLVMSFVSLWIKKSPLLWVTFLFIAIILALDAHILSYIALLPIGILFCCHYCLTCQIQRPWRFLLFCITTITSLALCFHFLPGFHNWKLLSDMQLSANGTAYSFYLNFDTPFSGLFVLALSLPLLQTRAEWIKMLKITLPITLLGIIGLSILAGKIGLINWALKIPPFFLPWLFANLFFVSIPQEALFRGFIQKELYLWFGPTPFAALGSIVLTSLFFVLLHLIWVSSVSFLLLVFIASIIYGLLYHFTQAIESSILCHFLLNLTHFLFFTYPIATPGS